MSILFKHFIDCGSLNFQPHPLRILRDPEHAAGAALTLSLIYLLAFFVGTASKLCQGSIVFLQAEVVRAPPEPLFSILCDGFGQGFGFFGSHGLCQVPQGASLRQSEDDIGETLAPASLLGEPLVGCLRYGDRLRPHT